LMANTSDFDAAQHALPLADLLEVDRYAMARASQLQAQILAHYEVYEFHPVVAQLQLYCSEDLGGFYLDVLKDRLYTTAAGSTARRSAQTALHHILQAMLRWMAPMLSFTAEEAWKTLNPKGQSIFVETYWPFAPTDEALIAKWTRIRAIRDVANKDIESLRAAGLVGSSLQAEITLTVPQADFAILSSLGDDLKYVFITSQVSLAVSDAADALTTTSSASKHAKCERCWHYVADVSTHAEHPSICMRCASNLYGKGEQRLFA
jgi:isoleucyl-tRNA synthetase